MGFDFSLSTLMAGFVFGVFGFYMLKNARKSGNFWHMLIGLGLMIYPYFVSGSLVTWGIGVALMAFAYYKR